MPRSLLGTRIRENRRSKKISQAALAKKVGISASYLNLIEHNRRGIGGKTLLSLAQVLEVDPRVFSEGADQDLVDRVKQAATDAPNLTCETERTEEFIARFPGFARLIARQFDSNKMHGETLQAMSDQLNSDPFFSEAMHLMLSHITTIRSTTEILADDTDVPEDIQLRFLQNLSLETQRLTQTTQDVLDHFEPRTQSADSEQDIPIFEKIMQDNAFYIPKLEGNFISPLDYVEDLDLSKTDKQEAFEALVKYNAIGGKLPIEPFLETAQSLKYEPLAISKHLDISLNLVLQRLAHMPNKKDLPLFGIVECDGAGAVIYRKQLPTLSLPRYGSACPLWPIYRSLSLPMQPIMAFINTPTGERFLTYSIASYVDRNTVGLPARTKAMMAFTSDYEMILSKSKIATLPNLAVGLQCSVCPRETCEARRTKYLLR